MNVNNTPGIINHSILLSTIIIIIVLVILFKTFIKNIYSKKKK